MKNKIKQNTKTIFDKIIFILIAIISIVLFIVDYIRDFIPNEKWEIHLAIVVIGVLSSFFTILSFYFDRKFELLPDIKKNLDENAKKIDNIDDFVNISKTILTGIDKVYFEINGTKNIEMLKFAKRRISELTENLTHLKSYQETEFLPVSEYYAELNYIAYLIENDAGNNKFIWAMTGFAEDEWSDNDYEAEWCITLNRLADKNIITKRACFINEELYNYIFKVDENDVFDEPISPKLKSSYKSFLDLLKTYYKKGKASNCEHYILKFNDRGYNNLMNAGGFFGVVLSNGDKHLIMGEAINYNNGLTGKVLFDKTRIAEIYYEFMRLTSGNISERKEIISYIEKNGKTKFKKVLESFDII